MSKTLGIGMINVEEKMSDKEDTDKQEKEKIQRKSTQR